MTQPFPVTCYRCGIGFVFLDRRKDGGPALTTCLKCLLWPRSGAAAVSNCPPEVFANVIGAPLCKSCGKVWGVEGGCVCAEPALEIPKPNPPAAEDFATIAQRLKEIEAEVARAIALDNEAKDILRGSE